MILKTVRTDYCDLDKFLNKIGEKNIVSIIPECSYDGCYFVIVYREKIG